MKVSRSHHSAGSVPIARNSGPGASIVRSAGRSPVSMERMSLVTMASISGERRAVISGMASNRSRRFDPAPAQPPASSFRLPASNFEPAAGSREPAAVIFASW